MSETPKTFKEIVNELLEKDPSVRIPDAVLHDLYYSDKH